MTDIPTALRPPERDAWAHRLARAAKADPSAVERRAPWAELESLAHMPAARLESLAFAGNYSFDYDPFEFGKRYVALETLGVSDTDRAIEKGEVVRFVGHGCLPYDGINEYFFERASGAPFSLLFEPIMGTRQPWDVLVFEGKLDRPATIALYCEADARTALLDAVGELLWRVRKAARAG